MLDEFIEAFTTGYLSALLWSERPDDIETLEGCERRAWGESLSDENIAPELMARVKIDCLVFIAQSVPELREAEKVMEPELLGHDFALTRNGQGTGYWDRDELCILVHGLPGFERFADDRTRSVGGILADYAVSIGPFSVYAGDDGLLYGTNG